MNQNTTERRYCEDCRFCATPSTGIAYARCSKAPETTSADRFVSRQFNKPSYAATMRADVKLCGPDAAWFEQAPAPLSVEVAA